MYGGCCYGALIGETEVNVSGLVSANYHNPLNNCDAMPLSSANSATGVSDARTMNTQQLMGDAIPQQCKLE